MFFLGSSGFDINNFGEVLDLMLIRAISFFEGNKGHIYGTVTFSAPFRKLRPRGLGARLMHCIIVLYLRNILFNVLLR